MVRSPSGGRYEILVDAELNDDWAAWFTGFEVETVGTTTKLVGSIPDQPALHGVLARLRDLGIPILGVLQVAVPDDDG